MLERLHIQGFKSLRDTTVELAPLTVVFGPNAAGKSNLLEALLLLARLVGERTLTEAFAEGIRGYPLEAFSLPPEGMEALLLQPRPTIRLEAEMSEPKIPGSTKKPSILSYQIAVGIDPQSGRLSVLDERLEDLHRNRRTRSKNPCLEKVSREKDGETVELLAIRKRGSQSPPFEEAIGLHHTIVSNRQYTGPERYPLFDQLHREIGAWRILYLDHQAMRLPQPPRDVDDIGSRGEWLVPYLHRLSHQYPQAFAAIRRVIASAVSGITDLRTELDEKRGVLNLSLLLHDTWMPVRVVSEGTLRLLALCAVAANPFNQGLVAVEEPENGVHPRRIPVVTRLLANASRRQQVIATTHSPLVVEEILQLIQQGELSPANVRLLRCIRTPEGSAYLPFKPEGPLFADAEISEALASSDDRQILQSMLVRGWLDG